MTLKINIMANEFQKRLISQGYSRKDGNLEWLKNGEIVTGKELNKKLNEWKVLANERQTLSR